jgi:hypothetical protein
VELSLVTRASLSVDERALLDRLFMSGPQPAKDLGSPGVIDELRELRLVAKEDGIVSITMKGVGRVLEKKGSQT